MPLLLGLLVIVSILLSAQAAWALYMMVYTWDQPDVDDLARAPEQLVAPSRSFTVIVPARHEEAVIAGSLGRGAHSHYPPSLLQIIVVCSAHADATIERTSQKNPDLEASGVSILGLGGLA